MKWYWKLILIGIGYFLMGGIIAYALFSAPQGSEKASLEIFLLGKKLNLDNSLHLQITSIGRHFIANPVELTDNQGMSIFFVPRDVGISIDYARLERIVRMIIENKGDVARFLQKYARNSSNSINLPLPLSIDYDKLGWYVLNLKYKYDKKPQEAKFDMDKKVIIPHSDGFEIMVDETIAEIEKGLTKGKNKIALSAVRTKPQSRYEDLVKIDISQVLGWYETPYCLMAKCLDRNNNLELGGKILDGTIVGPGEIFDFNEALGPRTEVRGFKPAPTIEQGTLTLSPGGGTCQTASTLYAAAFFAGMELLERRPHSRPSGYILLGLDATVTYPNINLVFRNPYDFPVVIHYKVKDGKMRVEILGKERRRIVHFIRRVTQVIPHDEKVIEESGWPKGVSVVTQLGIDGYRVRRYRVIWEGTRAWREMTENYYPPTTKITHVGTNSSMSPKGFVPPLLPDDHTPYSADSRIRFYLDENGEFKKIVAGW